MLKLRQCSTEKLGDLLKDAMARESIYWTELSTTLPDNSDDFVKTSERDEICAYLLEISDREDMSLSVETFGLCCALLDRFLRIYKVKSRYLQVLAVACLYVSCKVREEDENISVTAEFLVDCKCKCSVAELLRMELLVMTKFEWCINDVTPFDFLYVYHSLLVDAFNRSNMSTSSACKRPASNKWKIMAPRPEIATAALAAAGATDACYPPVELDFLHTLERKLKQCICVSDLTSIYRPHLLAFSLLSLQLDQQSTENIRELLNVVRTTHTRLNADTANACKEQIRIHLLSIESNNDLFDSYFDKQYFNMLMSYRQSLPIFMSPLAAVNPSLAVIKEEDEDAQLEEEFENAQLADFSNLGDINIYTDEEDDDCCVKSFGNIQSEMSATAASNVSFNKFDSMLPSGLTYADILAGRSDQKRKLSETSTTSSADENIECDIESRLN